MQTSNDLFFTHKSKISKYTIVDNYILHHAKHLTISARFLLVVALSLPDTWQFSIEGLVAFLNPRDGDGNLQVMRGQGREAIKGYLKELELNGYLIRKHNRKSGKFYTQEWHFFDEPQINKSLPQVGGVDDISEEYSSVNPSNYDFSESGEKHEITPQNTSSKPKADFTSTVEPSTVKPQQLNTNKDKLLINQSIPHNTTGCNSAQVTNSKSTTSKDSKNDGLSDERKKYLASHFVILCKKSLKPINETSKDKAYQAYCHKLSQGYTPEDIDKAYDRYVQSYKEANNTPKYAKQLHRWLCDADGLAFYGRQKPSKPKHNHKPPTAKNDEIERLKLVLEKEDEVYANMLSEYNAIMARVCMARLKNPDQTNAIADLEMQARRIHNRMTDRFNKWRAKGAINA